MMLLQPFEFVDPRAVPWRTQAPWPIDGASIPQVFWSVIGPYEDKYRDASVIHDYYCDTHERKWQDVHHMFYEAMRASGVGEIKAKIMFAAVWWKGPRWSTLNPRPAAPCMQQDARSICRTSRALESLNRMARNRAAIERSGHTIEGATAHDENIQDITRADVLVMKRLASTITTKNPPLAQILVLVVAATALSIRLQKQNAKLKEVIESRDSTGRRAPSPQERERTIMEEKAGEVVKDFEKR